MAGKELVAAKATTKALRNKSKKKIREREGKIGREEIVSEKSPPNLKKEDTSAAAAVAAMTTTVAGTSSIIKETKKDKKKRKEMLEKAEKRVMNEEQDVNLVGKKYDTPDERDPLRIFLEVLYQQLPNDELVASWMMEYGLLPFDEAKKDFCESLEGPVRDRCYTKLSTLSGEKFEKEGPVRDKCYTQLSTLSGEKCEKPAPKGLPKTKKRNRNEYRLAESSDHETRKEKKKKKTKFSS